MEGGLLSGFSMIQLVRLPISVSNIADNNASFHDAAESTRRKRGRPRRKAKMKVML